MDRMGHFLQISCHRPPPGIHNDWEMWDGVHDQAGKRVFCEIFTCLIQQICENKDKAHLLLYHFNAKNSFVKNNLGGRETERLWVRANTVVCIRKCCQQQKKYMGINNSTHYQLNQFEFVWRWGRKHQTSHVGDKLEHSVWVLWQQ